MVLAHIKAVLRRTGGTSQSEKAAGRLTVGDLEVAPVSHTATCAGRPLDLLHTLASRPDKAITTEDLLAQVWGAEFVGRPQVVYVHILWLYLFWPSRAKDNHCILTGE